MPTDQHPQPVTHVTSNGDIVPMFPRWHMRYWWHDCLVRRCIRCNREIYRSGEVCEVCLATVPRAGR